MMRALLSILFTVGICSPGAALAQGNPTWLYDQQVVLETPANDGLVRVALDPSVVARAGASLSDLRVVDGSHSDLPFALLVRTASPPQEQSWPAGAPREARRATLPTRPRSYVESFDLQLPDAPLPRDGWAIEVEIASAEFAAELTIASPDDPTVPSLSQSVFRMRDGSAQTRFALPLRAGPVIRVELRGQDGYLSPSFRFVSGAAPSPYTILPLPIDEATMRRLGDRPLLVFHTRGAVERKSPMRIVFGGRRGNPPAYARRADLEGEPQDAMLETVHGPVQPNPDHHPAPAMAFAAHPGRPVDARAFRMRAAVQIPQSTEGVTRITLTPSVVGEAAPGLADVRLVDANGDPWPYVVTYDDAQTRVAIRSWRVASPPGRSVYRLSRKVGALEARSLLVDPGTPLVDRPLLVEDVSDPDAPRLLARTRLFRASGDARGPIAIPLGDSVGTELRVSIDDADDAPLSPRFATPFRAPLLITVAPPGRYWLFLGAHAGSPESRRPVYELEHARALLLAIRPALTTPSAPEANPASEPPSAFSRERAADVGLWAVLGLAVVALVALTFRLSRSA